MTTAVLAVAVSVVTVNVAVVAPAATDTLAGTVAATGVPLESVTTAPPAGAAALNVTVARELVPPTTDVGATETLLRVCAEAEVAVTTRNSATSAIRRSRSWCLMNSSGQSFKRPPSFSSWPSFQAQFETREPR